MPFPQIKIACTPDPCRMLSKTAGIYDNHPQKNINYFALYKIGHYLKTFKFGLGERYHICPKIFRSSRTNVFLVIIECFSSYYL